MTQRHQRGSIFSFVVVGVLLTIAVVGGIYLVKNQLNGNMPSLPSGNDQVAQVEDEADDADPSDTTDESTQNQDEQSQDEAVTDQSTDEAVDQDDSATSDDESAATTEDDDVTTDETAIPQTGVVAETLPQTGVADNLYALVALGALVASIVAYRRSNIL